MTTALTILGITFIVMALLGLITGLVKGFKAARIISMCSHFAAGLGFLLGRNCFIKYSISELVATAFITTVFLAVVFVLCTPVLVELAFTADLIKNKINQLKSGE